MGNRATQPPARMPRLPEYGHQPNRLPHAAEPASGLPLNPCHEFPKNAPAAFFSMHALKDARFAENLAASVAAGKPVLITDALAAKLESNPVLNKPNVHILPVKGDSESLLEIPKTQLDALREPLLAPFRRSFHAPSRVALYLFKDRGWGVENFRNEPATAFSAKETGGTGENEPILMTITYGQGRIFHTVMGDGPPALNCAGFQVTLLRGAEWAATGQVTQTKWPDDFPTADKASARP